MLALFLCSGLAWAKPQVAIDSTAWHLDSTADGISLYSCAVPGTGVVPGKAVMIIPASIEEISCVLEDAPRRWDWISHFGGSELLERKNDYEQTEYLRVAMPWPVMDRSSLVRVTIAISDDQKMATVTARSVSCCARADLPELVRAEIYESTFQMRTVAGGTEVTALVFIDPKGSLPLWVVNLFTGGVSRQTLSGLRRQVAKRLYSEEVLAAMRERIYDYKALMPDGAAPSGSPTPDPLPSGGR